MFAALHSALHRQGHNWRLEDLGEVDEEAKRAMELLSSMVIFAKKLGGDWISPFTDMRADELGLGLLCLELLVLLRSGKAQSAVFHSKFLRQSFLVESNQATGLVQISPMLS